MKHFDYIFYRFSFWIKSNFNESNEYALSGYIVLSLFELINIFVLQGLIGLVIKKYIFEGHLVAAIDIMIVFIGNFVRYNRYFTYEMLDEKWNQESAKNRLRNGALVILYMLFTIASFFISGYIISKEPWRMIELLHQ